MPPRRKNLVTSCFPRFNLSTERTRATPLCDPPLSPHPPSFSLARRTTATLRRSSLPFSSAALGLTLSTPPLHFSPLACACVPSAARLGHEAPAPLLFRLTAPPSPLTQAPLSPALARCSSSSPRRVPVPSLDHSPSFGSPSPLSLGLPAQPDHHRCVFPSHHPRAWRRLAPASLGPCRSTSVAGLTTACRRARPCPSQAPPPPCVAAVSRAGPLLQRLAGAHARRRPASAAPPRLQCPALPCSAVVCAAVSCRVFAVLRVRPDRRAPPHAVLCLEKVEEGITPRRSFIQGFICKYVTRMNSDCGSRSE
ncbi:vegetative cell wall protein gp1-like [Miscanthus floridulus]|uniref:vegetative cell wall protein gp1-like n=1 Tax=Miscanthus floridulus TaxID=154761 RepID=UPI003459F33E